MPRPTVDEFEIDRVIEQRNRLHGWEWPRGVEASIALQLGVSKPRVSERRLELLLDRVRKPS